MISKSFLKSSFLYTVGGSMPVISGIVLLPFYTYYLSGKDFVAVGFYQGVSLLCQILFSLTIESYFGVKFTQLNDHPSDQRKFTGTISNLLIIIGIVLLLLSLLIGPFIFSAVFNDDLGVYFWPFGFYSILTGFFNSYFKTFTNSIVYFKRPWLHLSLHTINFILTVLFSLYGLYLFPNAVDGPVYGRLFSGLVIFIVAAYYFYQYSKFEFDRSYIPELIKFCLPVMLYAISGWALSYIDRYFLKSEIDGDTLASYHLILTCYLGIEFIQNGLSSAIYPNIFIIWNKNNKLETTKESNRYFNVFVNLNVLVAIAFCLLIPLVVFVFVRKPGYYDSFKYLGLISAGYATRSILYFYVSTILYSKNSWLLVKIFGISSIFQLALTWPMVYYFKLPGAIFAGLITKIFIVVLAALLTKKIFSYNFNYMKIYGLTFIYVIISVILYYLVPEFNAFVYIAELTFFCVLLYFIFKNEIKIVLQKFITK